MITCYVCGNAGAGVELLLAFGKPRKAELVPSLQRDAHGHLTEQTIAKRRYEIEKEKAFLVCSRCLGRHRTRHLVYAAVCVLVGLAALGFLLNGLFRFNEGLARILDLIVEVEVVAMFFGVFILMPLIVGSFVVALYLFSVATSSDETRAKDILSRRLPSAYPSYVILVDGVPLREYWRQQP